MSKTKSSSGKPRSAVNVAANKPVANTTIAFLPALNPQKKMLFILGALLAAWMIVLLIMYFKTVYPTRHDDPLKAHDPTVLPAN